MREPIDVTQIERNAQHLIHNRQQLAALVHADRDRQRQKIGLAGTLIMGALLVLVLAIILTSCIPATPVGRPPARPAPTLEATSTTAHPVAPTLPAPTSAAAHTTQPEPASCTVDAGGVEPGTVNVRSGPGMAYPVVDTVTEGEELPLYGPTIHGWRQTTTPQLVAGWFYITEWCKERNP